MIAQNIVEFILYIAPGFIAIYIYRFRYPTKEKDSFIEISSCIVFGSIIMATMRWVDENWLNYFFNTNFTDTPGIQFTLGIFIFGIAGGLLGILQANIRNTLAKEYNLYNFMTKNPDPIWKTINDNKQDNWAVVFLDDGSIYLGWISSYSYDAYNTDQEFLLGQAARINEDLSIRYEIDGIGVYLNTKHIKRIEFIKGDEKTHVSD